MKRIIYLLVLFFAKASFAQAPQLVIPTGHSYLINTIAISPDDKILASGSQDKTVKIWNILSGKELMTFTNFPGGVKSVGFSPNGKLLASISNKELRVNNLGEQGKEIFKQEVHIKEVAAMAFSEDNSLLATCSEIEYLRGSSLIEIKLWNVAKMSLFKTMEITGIDIKSIRFNNNEELTVIGKFDIYTVNLKTAILTQTELFGEYGFSKLSPDGKYILKDDYSSKNEANFKIGNQNSIINNLSSIKDTAALEVVDRKTKQIVHTFKGDQKTIKTIAFSPDSRYVVTGAVDSTIYIYDLLKMKRVTILRDTMLNPDGLAFTNDGKKLISGNEDKVIRIWDFEDKKLIKKLGGEANVIYNISLSPNGESLAIIDAPSFGNKGNIKVLDLKRSYVSKSFESENIGKNIKYSPDGKYLIAGCYKNGIGVWNVITYEKLKIFEKLEKATSFAISPDGKMMVCSNSDAISSELQLYSFPEGVKINTFPIPQYAGDILFSKDQQSIFVGFKIINEIRRINITTGEIIQDYINFSKNNYHRSIKKLLLNKDGTQLIVGNDDGDVGWYDVATAKKIIAKEVYYGGIKDMILLPELNQILMCGGLVGEYSNSGIHFKNANTLNNERTLNGHSNSANSLAVDPKNKFLFSGSYDRTVRIWDITTDKLIATMVFFGGSDWVIVDNDGRFDGTQAGMQKMYYVKGLETIPLESGYEQFYTPNLLPRILEGENFVAPPVNIVTLKDAPKVKIAAEQIKRNLTVEDDVAVFNSESEQVNIKVQADCPNDGVTEIRLFQNGKLVETTRNLTVEDENISEKSSTKTFAVTLLQGENRFKAIAFNTERTESKPAELIVSYKAIAKNEPVKAATTLHLIVVGINTYKNPKYNLNYALADATAFAEAITNGSKDLFTKTNTIIIKDADATKDGMTAAFEKIKAAAMPQDLFIFYYAGHGVINDKKEFFLVPYDVTQLYGNDGALQQNGFSAMQMQQMSKDIKAQKQLFILDACQSAGALNVVAGARGAAEEKAIAQLARATGTYWLTASSSEQFASEFSQLGHGSFTYCLLQAFKGEANLGDKKLTVKILDAYLQTKVPEVTQKYKGTAQYPVSYSYGNDFPIIIVK